MGNKQVVTWMSGYVDECALTRFPTVPTKASAKVGFRFQIPNSKFQIQDSRFKIQDSRFKIQGFRFLVPGSRFQVPDSKFQIAYC